LIPSNPFTPRAPRPVDVASQPTEDIYKPGPIDAQVVLDVFTHAQQVLREVVWPNGYTPSRQQIADFIDALRLEVFQKAARMRAAAPQVKRPQQTPVEPVADSRAAYAQYRGGLRPGV
jgi:hypothetical protein